MLSGAYLASAVVLAASLIVWRTGQTTIGLIAVLAAAVYLLVVNSPQSLGLSRPTSWWRVAACAVSGVVGALIASVLATPFVLAHFGPPDLAAFAAIRGSVRELVRWLVIAWTTAAFGEEIVFRGALLQRLEQQVGDRFRGITGVVGSSIVFGASHAYQGTSGAILTGLAGAVFALAFLGARRSLWASIIAHGLFDSFALTITFLGLGGP